MHAALILENVTAFRHAAFEFVPGINVFIGENGTGKTHLLKLLYAVQFGHHRDGDIRLLATFQAKHYGELVRSEPRAEIQGV